MSLINQNTGRVWQQSSWCPWITIVRTEDGTPLSPFDRFKKPAVTIKPSPEQPEVELPENVVGPLADIQAAIRVLNASWEQLAVASTPSMKRSIVAGFKAQAAMLLDSIESYAETIE